MRLTTGRAILYGGFTVGTLDLIDAFVLFGLRSGAIGVGLPAAYFSSKVR